MLGGGEPISGELGDAAEQAPASPASPRTSPGLPPSDREPSRLQSGRQSSGGRRAAAMRARILAELSGPSPGALLAAEAQSERYWRARVLHWTERIADGFYEVHGTYPEVCPPTEFPQLAALMQLVPKTGLTREVLLVDRRHDKHLRAMAEEAAEAVARAGGVGGGLAPFQALANVVAGHMGGALESQPAAAEEWCSMINSLKVQSALCVVPIGLLHMGSARHRALLYKVLASDLGLPCRVTKSRCVPGQDCEAAQAAILCDGEELYIDLLARPGEVSAVPADDQAAALAEVDALPPLDAQVADALSASLPPGLLATSAFASQPLPGRLRRSGSRQKLLPTFTSVPILPRAPRHTSGSGGGTPHWGGTPVAGSLLMAAASVQLTEEDRALLDALDAPARGAGAAQQQQQRAAAMPGGTSFTSHTLPLAANCSGEAAVAPPGLPQAESLEHALHLAAAAAMGGDSLLLRSSAGAERPADQAVSAGGSSTGAPRRASTGRPEGLARWDSQGLAAAEGQHSLPQRAVRGSCASAFPGEPSPSALQQPSPDEPRAAAEHAPGTPAPPAGIAAGDGGASPFDSAALSSPFGAVASPFGAQDQQASAFGAEEQQAALEGRPPPFAPGGGGAAATAPGAAPAPAAAAEHSAAVSGGEEDEGIELPIPKSAFSFGRSGARKLGHAHSAVAEDAWIDAAVEDEMSPAAGAAPPVAAAAAEAAAAAALAGAAAAQALPQRQHSLRSLGEFEGVSGLIDLSNRLDGAGSGAPRPPLLARLASQLGVLQQQQPASHVAAKQQQQVEQHQQQQQQPEQQQERQPAFGSPLPSVRGSDGVGTPRRSGSAALEALAELQAAQAARSSASTGPDVAAFPSAGAFAALPAAHPPHHPSLPVAQRRRSTSSGGLSGTLSFELGAPHLEVDEKTGEAFLVQQVVRAPSGGCAQASRQPSDSSTDTTPSAGDLMDLVEALRASGALDTGVLTLHSVPPSNGRAGAQQPFGGAPPPWQHRTFSEPLQGLQGRGRSSSLEGAAAGGGNGTPPQPRGPPRQPSASASAAGGGAAPASPGLYGHSVGGLSVIPHIHRRSFDTGGVQPAGPRRLVPIEWEQQQAMLRDGGGGGGAAEELVTARRSASGSDAGGVLPTPFGGGIPEGGPLPPTAAQQLQLAQQLAAAAGTPFSSGLHAVAAGGMLSLGAMQLAQAQVAQVAAAAARPRRSDNSSLTGGTGSGNEGSSLHSAASDGAAHASAFAGLLEGLEEWEILPDEIVLGPRIGIGSFGEVYRGIWRQTDVAVKRLLEQEVSHQMLDEFRQEISIMKRLRHPHIVQFLGAVTQPPHLCIVTQFVPRGSLFKLLHRTPAFNPDERRRLQMALDIARGMNFLHTCKPPIIHRDLKSPNLLVDKDLTVKVCDFGLSRARRSTMMSTKSQAGTPEWTAPEVLRSQLYNEKCDCYSYGVILWELFTNEEPWQDKSAMQVVGAVGWSNMRLPLPDDVPPAMRDLILECFGEPAGRPTFGEMIPRLKTMIKALGPPPGHARGN